MTKSSSQYSLYSTARGKGTQIIPSTVRKAGKATHSCSQYRTVRGKGDTSCPVPYRTGERQLTNSRCDGSAGNNAQDCADQALKFRKSQNPTRLLSLHDGSGGLVQFESSSHRKKFEIQTLKIYIHILSIMFLMYFVLNTACAVNRPLTKQLGTLFLLTHRCVLSCIRNMTTIEFW